MKRINCKRVISIDDLKTLEYNLFFIKQYLFLLFVVSVLVMIKIE